MTDRRVNEALELARSVHKTGLSKERFGKVTLIYMFLPDSLLFYDLNGHVIASRLRWNGKLRICFRLYQHPDDLFTDGDTLCSEVFVLKLSS